jgi:DNA (cytosine-5)-methyltransferase 1
MYRADSTPTVTELFAGAGLFSYAFLNEGFRVVRAIEIDSVAAATYSKNIGGYIEVADVLASAPSGRCEVLAAGSPCQSFSTLGKRRQDDPRAYLSMDVLRWAKALQPKIVVVENVVAFLNAPVWKSLASGLNDLGYEVSVSVLNAFDFGAPQNRLRSFTFASRVGTPVVRPVRSHRVSNVRQAWYGLPSIPDGINHHYAPQPSELALARMRVIQPGGDKRDVMRYAPELAPPSWWKLNCQVTDVWGRMEWDKPSNTIRTALLNPSKGRYIHPEQHRVISLREAARLHTIPDDWKFAGLPTQIARQIGNSVPPSLGRVVARAIFNALK